MIYDRRMTLIIISVILAQSAVPSWGYFTKHNCTNITEQHCERHSKLYDQNVYGLDCETLNHCEPQHCYIKNDSEWDCLFKKANMFDESSTKCYNKAYDTVLSSYFEVCALPYPKFACSIKNCANTDSSTLACVNNHTIDGKCPGVRSLIYCPPDNKNCIPRSGVIIRTELQNIFKEHCLSRYEELLGEHKIWLYLDLFVGNGTPLWYGEAFPISREELDPMSFDHVVCELPPYAIILVAVFALLVIVAISFGVLRFRRYRKHQNKLWDEAMEQYMERQCNFVLSIPPETSEPPSKEQYEEMAPVMAEEECENEDPAPGAEAAVNTENPSSNGIAQRPVTLSNKSYTGLPEVAYEEEDLDDHDPDMVFEKNTSSIGPYVKHI